MNRPYELDDPAFEGHELFPAINVAETVDKMIEERGIFRKTPGTSDV